MLQPESPRDGLTKRQLEVLERLELGYPAKKIATDLGISRNAVYQTIERLRRQGAIADTYTPSGQPPRRAPVVGSAVPLGPAAVSPRDSVLRELRELGEGPGADAPEYARAIEAAIASGDAVALAYELGRLDDAGEGDGLQRNLIESALERLGVLSRPGLDAGEK